MRTVFFDLDGTLTDPRLGIVRSIQFALERLNRPVLTEEDLLWCIGPPLRQSFVQLLEGEGDADLGVAFYRERFADVGLFENEPYPGIADQLQALLDQGVTLHVATSKPHVFAEQILDHFGLTGYFGGVYGSELSGERADKSDLLAYALEDTGVDGTESIMVGDRSHDMVGAASNGMSGVGVLYGYGSREELVRAGARTIVASVSELRGVLTLALKGS